MFYEMFTMRFVLFVAVVFKAEDAFLEILPILNPIRKEVGSNLALTCRPGGADQKHFSNLEWRHNSTGTRIEVTNKANPLYIQKLLNEPGIMLIFNGLTKGQAGNYSCHANYGGSPLTATVEVHTFVDVQFVDAPENQFPIAGKNFVVKCKVKGDPPPTIDWYRGDQLIEENSSKYIRYQDELHITNVTEQDDGIYKCSAVVVVTGVYKTRNIKVEVLVPPKIQPISEIFVVEGEAASVKCSATGKPPPTYTWIKLDQRKDLSKTDRFGVKKTTGDLIMNRVEFRDNGYYQCKAENRAGQVEAKVKINVLVKPKIYELVNVTTSTENETSIICKAIGRPPANITFRKLSNQDHFIIGKQRNDPRIDLEQKKYEETGESTGTLTISNISRSDDGLYECIAENTIGKAYKNGHITVWFKPTFNRTKNLPPVWSWDNKPGNLSCLPEAIPNATITWRYQGTEITEENFNSKKLQRDVFKVHGHSPQSFLEVKPYENPSYYTKYECIAKNILGEARIKIELKQAFKPNVVNQARADTVTATTIKFSIIPPSNYDGPILRSYIIEYKTHRTPDWNLALRHSWSYGAPYILENLIPEETYQFRIAAVNDVGIGDWLNMHEIEMPPRSKPAEPTILLSSSSINRNLTTGQEEVTSQYSNHFELRWNIPADNGEPIDFYDIKYCTLDKVNNAYQKIECIENIQQSVQATNYQLENLMADTLYAVEVRAHNVIGYSTPAAIIVKTARGPVTHQPVSASISSGLIIGIVVAVILVILIVIDLTCCLVNRTGLIAMCLDKCGKKKRDEEDQKLDSYKAAPAHPNSLNLPQPIKLTGGLTATVEEEQQPLQQPATEKRTTVEFDGRQVFTKSGEIIGKHSAV